MGIDLTKFATDNLISGYREKSFSRVQINIFSMNYMMRGILSNDDILFINDELDKIDELWELEELERELTDSDVGQYDDSDVSVNPPLVIEE